MLNPLEFKHDIASIPLKWMIRQPHDPADPQYHTQAVIMALTGMLTAAVNLTPALFFIDMGIVPQMRYSHTTYVRFNPWAKPIFHYTRAASRAELIGGRIGGSIGKHLAIQTSNLDKYGKIWRKAGLKGGVKVGARVGGRLIPGVGWALLDYDVYDIAYNRSLWGFDF